MGSFDVKIADVGPHFPPGVTHIIGHGSSCFVGLIDPQTVLKYPYFPDDRSRIEVEHKLLQHAGRHRRIIESAGLTESGLLLWHAVNGTLHDYILLQQHHGEQLSVAQRLRYCVQIAEGIVHLHSRSVYHGDLRPGNILLDEALDVKIADVQGVLKSGRTGEVVLDGLARENYMYFMPRNGDYLDTKTDLFAFGSTMHFIMTGGQEVFDDLLVPPTTDDRQQQQQPQDHQEEQDRREKEAYRRFVEKEFPDTSHLCTAIVQRCWRGEYETADQVLDELRTLG